MKLLEFEISIDGRLLDSRLILPPSHFICPIFRFRMSQNIVLFLKIKVINLLMFLLYPINLLIQFFDKFI